MSAVIGYGTDTWCADTLVTGRMATGVQAIGLALFRRYITPRGTLQGLLDENGEFQGDAEAAYGFDVASYVGAVGYDTAINALPGIMRAEALKDDRVSDVAVNVTRVDNSDGTIDLTIELDVTPFDSEDSFALTLAVSDAKLVFGGVA